MTKRTEPDPVGRAISLKAFAKELGIGRSSIQQAIKEGRIRSAVRWGKGWTITDADKARTEYESNSRPRSDKNRVLAAQGDGKPAPATLAAATLRERIARARLIELDFERRRRALVPAREVELYLSTMVVGVRTAILGIPSRAKQRLPHLSVADLAILDELQREALEGLVETEWKVKCEPP